MTWQEERRKGQFCSVVMLLAFVGAFLTEDAARWVLVYVGVVCFFVAAAHGLRALRLESKEKGWPDA